MSEDKPSDQFTIKDNALILHEWYTNLVQAGFTEEQATLFVVTLIGNLAGPEKP